MPRRIAIIVTFDLHDVSPKDKWRTYTNIKRDLANLKLTKFLVKADGDELALPRNTFVGFLKGRVTEASAAEVRDEARERVMNVIERHHHRATVFVFVGKSWAWARPTLR